MSYLIVHTSSGGSSSYPISVFFLPISMRVFALRKLASILPLLQVGSPLCLIKLHYDVWGNVVIAPRILDLGRTWMWEVSFTSRPIKLPCSMGRGGPRCYKSEGRWFDPSWCQWIFHWHNPSDHTMAQGSTQLLTEMSTRSISWE